MVSSFSAFDVSGTCTTAAIGPENMLKLKRIAQVCNICPQTLMKQFADHYPRARHIAKEEGTLLNRWEDIGKRSFRQRHPWGALLTSLQLYSISATVKHGVEGGFSKTRLIFSDRRHGTDATSKDFVTCLIHDLPKFAGEKMCGALVNRARVVFAKLWGRTRRSNIDSKNPRLNKGVARYHLRNKGNTEISFLRARRAAISNAVCASNGDHLTNLQDLMEAIPKYLQHQMQPKRG